MNDFQIVESFPTIISPPKKMDFQDLIDELPNYKAVINELLLSKGALLFRGFPVHAPEQF